jgi:4-aminobutyrate aminotransferase-like enzyme
MFIFSFSPKVSHSSDPEAGKKYANAVKEAIEEFARRGEKLAGFIHESIQGVGG